ncbi:chemotaxis protein CheX [Ferrigenium kumadai]|nr:chemotaxis protein CheX [Ferrigenium kumadai]
MTDGSHMDILMIHALLDSLFTIFATMVRLRVQPGIPEPKQGKAAKGVVSALIGMKGEGACGSVALSLPLPAIREISRNLLGHEIASADNEAADLAGELVNMLVGGAKRILSEQGHDFDMQTPQLLLGEGHEIVHHYPGQTVLLPVNIGQSEFYIELNFV